MSSSVEVRVNINRNALIDFEQRTSLSIIQNFQWSTQKTFKTPDFQNSNQLIYNRDEIQFLVKMNSSSLTHKDIRSTNNSVREISYETPILMETIHPKKQTTPTLYLQP